MKIHKEKCIGCKECIPYCNVGAITMNGDKAVIDQETCTECWVCYRNGICPVDAITTTELTSFSDEFKHVLSDATETTAETGIPGRGTAESKTNDVTGRYGKDVYGITVDVGRPGVGTKMSDVEKVAMALAEAGVELSGPEENPLGKLMTDLDKGKIDEQYYGLNVLSIIVEGTCSKSQLSSVLEKLLHVENEIETVFSLGIVAQAGKNKNQHLMDTLEELGIDKPIRGKVNVGLGRPLATE